MDKLLKQDIVAIMANLLKKLQPQHVTAIKKSIQYIQKENEKTNI